MDTQTRSNDTASRGASLTPPGMIAPPRWAEADGYYFDRMIRRTPATDVYLARYQATGAFREVIVVQGLAGVDQAALRRSVDVEVFAAGALRHTGIAPVVDVGRTRDGRLYVASARPVGRALSEVLAEDGAMTSQRVLDLGPAIIDLMEAAHSAGVVHGWLTPDSVVIVPKQGGQPERVVLVGFGTAVAQDGMPVPGAFQGELYPFASPERAAGEPASVRGDVFSLGSVILSMFLGGPLPVVWAAAGRNGPVAEPETITQVLWRARAAHPDERYASAADFGAALKALNPSQPRRLPAERPLTTERLPVADEGAPTGGAALLLPLRNSTRQAYASLGPDSAKRRGALVAAGVAGLLAAGGAALTWRSHTEPAFPPLPAETARQPTQAAPSQPVPGPVVASVPAQASAAPSIPSSPPERVAPLPEPAPPAARELALASAPPRPVHVESRTVPSAARPAAPVRDAQPGGRPLPAAARPLPQQVATREVGTANGRAANSRTPAPATLATSASGDVVAASPKNPGVGTAVSAPAGTEEAISVAGSASGVRAAVAEYATAIEARDLAWLRRVYPGMTEKQRSGWVAFFGSVANLHTRLVVGEITTAGATVQARVHGMYEYQNLRPHRAERLPVSFTATLTRDASGWRVRTVE